MLLEGEEWRQFVHSFQRERFRLETQPGYTVPEEEEELRRWRSGEKRPKVELSTDPYLVKLQEHARAGRRMRRVHTITSPLNEHIRFQCEWGYAFSVQAGEEVHLLDFSTTPDPGLPDQDFWLLDDEHVVLMHYAADGTPVGRELLENTDPTPWVRYKNLALEHATPLTKYYKVG